MDYAYYSISLILAFAFARYVTVIAKIPVAGIHLKFSNQGHSKFMWIHHWILATLAMIVLLLLEISEPYVWGALTGVALEGLPRKNWSIRNKR